MPSTRSHGARSLKHRELEIVVRTKARPTWVSVQVPHNLIEWAKATEAFKVREGHCHLRLVVVVFVHVRTLSMKTLGQPLVKHGTIGAVLQDVCKSNLSKQLDIHICLFRNLAAVRLTILTLHSVPSVATDNMHDMSCMAFTHWQSVTT